jgi:hypothetical protein
MKKLFLFLTLSLIVIGDLSSQTIFSVIHLNDKQDIQNRYASIIEWKCIEFTEKGRNRSNGTMFLNHNNMVKIEKENDLHSDSWQNAVITNFNSKTGLVESRIYNKPDGDGFRELFKYDTNKFVTEILHLDKYLHVLQHTSIINNENGFPVELVTYNQDRTLAGDIEKAEYLYKENKYISKIYSSDGVLLSSSNEILNFNTNFKFKNPDLEYNESGDLIKSCISDNGYNLYKYKYDKFSNWIKYRVYAVTFSNGKQKKKLITIYTRKIVYWEKDDNKIHSFISSDYQEIGPINPEGDSGIP